MSYDVKKRELLKKKKKKVPDAEIKSHISISCGFGMRVDIANLTLKGQMSRSQ